jgi:hypothetical protein
MLTPLMLVMSFVGLFFLLGFLTFIAGILILVFRTSSSEVKALATQTARLAQKGIAEEVAGLVGNASTLVDAMNQLVRTTRGVGIFLTVLGLLMMIAACYLAIQVIQIQK